MMPEFGKNYKTAFLKNTAGWVLLKSETLYWKFPEGFWETKFHSAYSDFIILQTSKELLIGFECFCNLPIDWDKKKL